MYRDEIKFWDALRIFVDAYIDEICRLDRTESHNPVVHIQGLRVLQRLLGTEASKAEARKMQADFQNKLKKTGKSGTEIPAPDRKIMPVDEELFKELLQLVLNLPDLGSKLAAIDIDSGSASTGEFFVRLEPSDFLLRLNAALRACG